MTNEIKTVLTRIEGRVQGVWYRAWTTKKAKALGLNGWVRNRHDRSVEALFSGPTEAVDAMLDACRKGPPAARVDAVLPKPADPPEAPGFEQKPTC